VWLVVIDGEADEGGKVSPQLPLRRLGVSHKLWRHVVSKMGDPRVDIDYE
jgi:hypothetical protein